MRRRGNKPEPRHPCRSGNTARRAAKNRVSSLTRQSIFRGHLPIAAHPVQSDGTISLSSYPKTPFQDAAASWLEEMQVTAEFTVSPTERKYLFPVNAILRPHSRPNTISCASTLRIGRTNRRLHVEIHAFLATRGHGRGLRVHKLHPYCGHRFLALRPSFCDNSMRYQSLIRLELPVVAPGGDVGVASSPDFFDRAARVLILEPPS